MTRTAIKDWIDRHFSDNERAQTTIAIIGSAVAAIGVVLFAVAAFLLMHAG
jgi:hypothetical protein